MTGRTDRRFWKCFKALPPTVQKLAREKYALWKRDPYHLLCILKRGATGSVLLESEITTAPLDYAKAM